MTPDIANQRGSITPALRSLGGKLFDSFRLGGLMVRRALLILAIAAIPELVQHVVEIRLGMFDSIEMFHAHGTDAIRMAFGYVKVAGFVIAILASARFWWLGSVRAALLPPPRDLLRIVGAIVVSLAAQLPFEWLRAGMAQPWNGALLIIETALGTALTVYIIAALFGDRAMTLRRVFTAAWGRALLIVLLMAVTYGPCFAVHLATHKLALGLPLPLVIAIMTFDGLFIGLFAALVGSAMFVGYASDAERRIALARHGL
jgi:hypothetical protein